ncbi:MAG: response regulator transcription factor [Firmicutes bacterium]|nr:response regulator transcription factor [Bacillota bacterium]
MLRIGICDDESMDRDMLRWELEKTEFFQTDAGDVVYEFSSGEVAVSWLKQHKGQLDLVFLDIEMKRMDGIETARQIRSFDEHLMLVFLTGYRDFVFQGYQVEAMDYLVKPVHYPALEHLLKRAEEKLRAAGSEKRCIVMKNGEGFFRIYMEDVLYCYSQGRQIHVVRDGETPLTFYKKLDEMEERLNSQFVRIHQRYVVNSRFVEFIGHEQVRMKDGALLPISRNLRTTAMTALAKNMIIG